MVLWAPQKSLGTEPGTNRKNEAHTPVDRSTLPGSALKASRTSRIPAVEGTAAVKPELVRTKAWKAKMVQRGGTLGNTLAGRLSHLRPRQQGAPGRQTRRCKGPGVGAKPTHVQSSQGTKMVEQSQQGARAGG